MSNEKEWNLLEKKKKKGGGAEDKKNMDIVMGFCPVVCLMESYPWKMKGCLRLTLDGSPLCQDHNLMQVYAGFLSTSLETSVLNYAETTVLQD